MTEQTSQLLSRQSRFRPSAWSIGAALIALIVVMPILAVLWFAATPSDNIWPHLVSTTLPRYLRNTAVLMVGVGLLTALIGTITAWLVVMYRFPGAGWLQWALLMPLANRAGLLVSASPHARGGNDCVVGVALSLRLYSGARRFSRAVRRNL